MFGNDWMDAFFGKDPTVPIKDDPAAEANRLARQWRALSDRLGRLIERYPEVYKR